MPGNLELKAVDVGNLQSDVDKRRTGFYCVGMHPVRRALNVWKAAHEGATDADFAGAIGYADPDALYKQIRGEYLPPHDKLKAMAEVLGWTPGRFLNECNKTRAQQMEARAS
jgi:hypothetical protein